MLKKDKSLVNQMLTRDLWYPDPGSNRDGLLHWCLRPARLPIPPSGHGSCVRWVQRYTIFLKWQRLRGKYYMQNISKELEVGKLTSKGRSYIIIIKLF